MTDPRFGYTPQAWERMVDAGYDHLTRLARRGGHTDYTSFCDEVRRVAGTAPLPGDHALAYLLGDIARASFDRDGVVVTVLVHYKGQGFGPGPGFFAISQDLGLLPSGTLDDDQKMVFLAAHTADVERTYRKRRR